MTEPSTAIADTRLKRNLLRLPVAVLALAAVAAFAAGAVDGGIVITIVTVAVACGIEWAIRRI